MLQRLRQAIARLRDRLSSAMKRKPDRFLERLQQQSALCLEGAVALSAYMTKPNKKNARRVEELEKEADEVRRILVDELNRTFVTPFDREDIHMLSRAIDDILDDTWFTINEMDILSVEPTTYLQEMAQLLVQGTEEIKLAVERLEGHPRVASDHANRAKAVDNRVERLYAEAIAALFQKPKDLDSVVNMLKLREIYRHLFHAAGRISDAANTINDVVMKFF